MNKMKKRALFGFLVLILAPTVWAVSIAASLPVFAADLDVSGDFRVRGFYTNNLTDQSDAADDETAYNSLRFLLTTTASAGLATGVVTLDFTSANNTGNLRFGEDGGAYGPKDNRFALLEAYLLADLRVVLFSAGRRDFKIGHGIIFEDPADGFFLNIPLGPAKLTLANLKPFDCSNKAGTNPAIGDGCTFGTGGDTDLYFANLSLRPAAELSGDIFLGVYRDRGPNISAAQFAAGTTEVHLYILGGTAEVGLGPVNLTGEIDYLWGDMEGNTQDADLDGLNAQLGGECPDRPR